MTIEELVLSLAENEESMAALTDDQRKFVLSYKKENEERIKAERNERERKDRAFKKAEERLKAERRNLFDKLLCKGTWGELVPPDRRFCLCERDGKRFVGFCGQEDDPTKWKDKLEYCVIDIVRGYTSPYWGYYDLMNNHLKAWYKERMHAILSAETEDERAEIIIHDFNFFNIDDEERNDKFRILDYEVDGNGNVTVVGRSKDMTLKQHQEALKREFAKK